MTPGNLAIPNNTLLAKINSICKQLNGLLRNKRSCLMLISLGLFSIATSQTTCTEISSAAGIDHTYLGTTYLGGGAAFFDYNNDGFEDIWITGGINMDALYHNNGDGTFSDIGLSAGLWVTNSFITTGVITGDIDNDGYRDVLVLTHMGHRHLLFKNNGDGTFSESALFTGPNGLGAYVAQTHAAAFGDINLDGYLDIYLATYIENIQNIYEPGGTVIGFQHICHDNFLFLNDGANDSGEANWTFTEVGNEYEVVNGGCSLAATFTDFDNDADPDLLIANDFGEWIVPNTIYQNNPTENTLSDVSQSTGMDVGIYGMGIATGDYDQDADLDYYITNLGRNVLLQNQTGIQFIDQSEVTGVEDTFMDSLLATGWGTAFMDIDNDTDLDLFVCNGHIPAAGFIKNSLENKNRLFLNDGVQYSFTDIAETAHVDDGGRGRGFAYSDFDNDGDLDFLIVNNNRQATPDSIHPILFYRNELSNKNNWLKVKLTGVENNRDGYGATIRIVVGEKSWIHDYNGGFGTHASQHSSIAHFGLGKKTMVDSLIITWPGGNEDLLINTPANQLLNITEGSLISSNNTAGQDNQLSVVAYPNPFNQQVEITFHLTHPAMVSMDMLNPIGQKIKTVAPFHLVSGKHTLNLQMDKQAFAEGIYILRLHINGSTKAIKLIRKK